MEIGLSIILPVYNVAPYLDRCLNSIINQTYSNIQIVLVDDGSTDDSGELCEQWVRQDNRIEVVHKANGGLSSARNKGMERAVGKYIFFIDPDDWIVDGALSKIWEDIEKNNFPDIVKYNFTRHYLDGTENKFFSCAEPGYYNKKQIEERIFLDVIGPQYFTQKKDFLISAWSHIYRREFLSSNKLTFVSERLVVSEDWVFNVGAYALAQTLYIADNAYYIYDIREGSLTQKYINDLHEKRKTMYKSIYTFLDEHGLLSECVLNRLYSMYLKLFYFGVIDNEISAKGSKSIAQIKLFLNDDFVNEIIRKYKRDSELKETLYCSFIKYKCKYLIYLIKHYIKR